MKKLINVVMLVLILTLVLSFSSFGAMKKTANVNSKGSIMPIDEINEEMVKDAKGYLKVLMKFSENVLTYGRDVYGEKHTPLFADGLNIYNQEPAKWVRRDDEWILSNLGSQQNLFRTFVGMTNLTKNHKFRQQAEEAIMYAFENLRGYNGLLYWGGHVAYDLEDDKVVMERYDHELKYHYPYYQFLWEINPKATKQHLESMWASHIYNWSNLDFDRHASFNKKNENLWDDKYVGGEVLFKGTGLTFICTGSDLYYAAAVLSKLTGEKKPLIWAKRLAHRYVETRNPKTGIGGYQYSSTAKWTDRAEAVYGDHFPGHLVVEGTLFPCYGNRPHVRPRIVQMFLGEMLGEDGKEFTQWAIEELTAWGKSAYRVEDNSFIPMLTDGTSMEGFVYENENNYYAQGRKVLTAGKAGSIEFWTYALGFRVSEDTFLWEMTRNICIGNDFGDIGKTSENKPKLNINTTCSDAEAVLGFLELHKKTGEPAYIYMAKKIGDNILKDHFHRGFFVESKDHIYAKFDRLEPLALLHLAAAIQGRPELVPIPWPSRSFFN